MSEPMVASVHPCPLLNPDEKDWPIQYELDLSARPVLEHPAERHPIWVLKIIFIVCPLSFSSRTCCATRNWSSNRAATSCLSGPNGA